jgi:undecaprenol kinase/diacylglycerol kinase (ATP)
LVVDIIAGVTILIVATILNNWSPLLPVEWAVIVLMIGVVIGTELLNTAIENLVDVVTFKYNYAAKKIKDVSAAATLILSIVAIVVGLVIFIPHIISLFH